MKCSLLEKGRGPDCEGRACTTHTASGAAVLRDSEAFTLEFKNSLLRQIQTQKEALLACGCRPGMSTGLYTPSATSENLMQFDHQLRN